MNKNWQKYTSSKFKGKYLMVSTRNVGFREFRVIFNRTLCRSSMREKDEWQNPENCLMVMAGEWVLRES